MPFSREKHAPFGALMTAPLHDVIARGSKLNVRIKLGYSDLKWVSAIHFLYVAAIIFAVSCLAVIAVSLLTPPPPQKKVSAFTWHNEIYNRETSEIDNLPIMWNYRYQSLALIIFLILVLFLFW